MIAAFKFCARAIFNLLEKTHPPGSQNLSSRNFSHYSTLQVPKEAIYIKTRIQIAVLRNWEQFQICSVFFIHPVDISLLQLVILFLFQEFLLCSSCDDWQTFFRLRINSSWS